MVIGSYAYVDGKYITNKQDGPQFRCRYLLRWWIMLERPKISNI